MSTIVAYSAGQDEQEMTAAHRRLSHEGEQLEDVSHHSGVSSLSTLSLRGAAGCGDDDDAEDNFNGVPHHTQLALVFFDVGAHDSSWVCQAGPDGHPMYWPAQLLPQDFPAATILSLNCAATPAELRSSAQRGVRAADALLAALMRVHAKQLVLVGHGFGGHMLKEVCLEVCRRTHDPSLPPADRQHCRSVLHCIAGAAFYSTPHKPLPRLALWPEYEYVLPDVAGVCSRFRQLAISMRWQTLGVGAGVQGPPQAAVPLSAASKGMGAFRVAPADQWGVSRPSSTSHPGYVALASFLQGLAGAPAAGGARQGAAAARHGAKAAPSAGGAAAEGGALLQRSRSLKRVLSGLLGRAP